MSRTIAFFILSCTLCLATQKGNTQDQVNFQTIDSITYNQYLNADWKDLLATGKNSIDNGLDYYYLRMRMGWARYSQGNYRKAIKHYEKALNFNSTDPTAMALLMASYEYSGRKKDAIALSTKLNPGQHPELYKRYKKTIKDATIFVTYSKAATASITEYFEQDFTAPTEGLQKIPYHYYYPQLGLSHNIISNRILLEHKAAYLKRSEYSYFTDNLFSIVTDPQTLHQLDYSASLHITPVSGLQINPGTFLSYVSIPVYETNNNGFGRNTSQNFLYNITETNLFLFLKLQKEFGYFSLGLSGGMGSLNFFTTKQAGGHLKLYPLGNLNLYITSNAYLQQQMSEQRSINSFIHLHKLGFKVAGNFWLEAEAAGDGLNNLYDVDANTMYNALETIQSYYGLRGIITRADNRLLFVLSYRYTKASSGFMPQNDPLAPLHLKSYSTNIFTGGITWKI